MKGLHITEERRLAGRLAAALYLIGAATASLLVVMPGVPVGEPAVVLGLAGAGAVWGVLGLTVVPWERAPALVSHASTFAGLPITAVAMAETGGATSPARFYLIFVIFYCSYFYPSREAVAYIAMCTVVHALPLAYDEGAVDGGFAAELLVIVPTYAVLGGFIIASKALLVRLREASRLLSLSDPLTGVANRRAFETMLRTHAEGERSSDVTGLLLVDLDDFKAANTLLGHTGGDRVLLRAAAALREAARGNDMVARLGGDEFAIVAVGVTEDGMRNLADRALQAINRANGPDPGEYRLSASAGWAIYPHHARTVDGLIEAADRALAGAKDSGKASWRAASEPSGASRPASRGRP
jgi:diguanylate cyclase (GGDEF)-like protein